jgi:hypothetical protein
MNEGFEEGTKLLGAMGVGFASVRYQLLNSKACLN